MPLPIQPIERERPMLSLVWISRGWSGRYHPRVGLGFLYLVPREVSRLPASGFRIVDSSLSSPFIPEIGPQFIQTINWFRILLGCKWGHVTMLELTVYPVNTINQLLNCAAILFVDHRSLSCHGLNWEIRFLVWYIGQSTRVCDCLKMIDLHAIDRRLRPPARISFLPTHHISK